MKQQQENSFGITDVIYADSKDIKSMFKHSLIFILRMRFKKLFSVQMRQVLDVFDQMVIGKTERR